MKIKRIIILVMIISLLCISGCSGTKEEEKEAEVPNFYETVAGTYHEETAGRGQLVISTTKEDGADVEIRWSSSAAEYSVWNMHIYYNEENAHLDYKDGSRTDHVVDSDGNENSEVIYTDGSGYFEVGEDNLTWYEDNSDANDGAVFVIDK